MTAEVIALKQELEEAMKKATSGIEYTTLKKVVDALDKIIHKD